MCRSPIHLPEIFQVEVHVLLQLSYRMLPALLLQRQRLEQLFLLRVEVKQLPLPFLELLQPEPDTEFE